MNEHPGIRLNGTEHPNVDTEFNFVDTVRTCCSMSQTMPTLSDDPYCDIALLGYVFGNTYGTYVAGIPSTELNEKMLKRIDEKARALWPNIRVYFMRPREISVDGHAIFPRCFWMVNVQGPETRRPEYSNLSLVVVGFSDDKKDVEFNREDELLPGPVITTIKNLDFQGIFSR